MLPPMPSGLTLTATALAVIGLALPLVAPPAQHAPAPLDPLLRAAIDELGSSTGYCFDAGGNALLPFDPVAPLARIGGPLARLADLAAFMAGTDIHGRFERSDPLLLVAGRIQAFRADGRMVFRRRLPGEWGPWTGASGTADIGMGEELRLLDLLARLPAPEELLATFSARTTTCVRTDDPKREGLVTFECQIRPEAGWTLQARRPGQTPSEVATCTLRVTVDRGSVMQIELESLAPMSASSIFALRAAPNPPAEETVVVRYRIHDIGTTKVSLPAPAARLLDDSRS